MEEFDWLYQQFFCRGKQTMEWMNLFATAKICHSTFCLILRADKVRNINPIKIHEKYISLYMYWKYLDLF